MSLPLPTSLTPSKVSSFKDCALAFRFSAIDRIPEPPAPWSTKGTLVHRALELLFWEEAPGRRAISAALEKFERAWVEIQTDPEFVELNLDDVAKAEFRDDARTLVESYFRLEDPNLVRVIGTEIMLEVRLGTLLLRGKIDRLELDEDGELIVTDYKTGRAPTEKFEQGKLTGIQFYAFLCEQVLGRRPKRIQLLHLREPISISCEPSDQSIKGLQTKTSAIWTAVERACASGDFRPRPSRLCDWCHYRPYCPAYGGDPTKAGEPSDVTSASVEFLTAAG